MAIFFKIIFTCSVVISLSFNAFAETNPRMMLGQKLMLDIRYFCADNTPSKQCRKPVTQLPDLLKDVFKRHHIGGVILFTENLTTPTQIQQLTKQLHALATEPQLPMLIGIDQEGGRVARLPTDFLPAFAGNMAIGATYAKDKTRFAKDIGTMIGRDLASLGINVNFAPTIDVNANPDNPVINVRSYGESVTSVSALGAEFTTALQAQSVLAAIKHFPGHGDTHVDSHTGLPRVDHDRATILAQDVAPFAHIIQHSQPALVMTAHIQYPGLDNTTLLTQSGQQIRPATLSNKILTGLLRERLQFDGLIITDALDMAGIAQYFQPLDAVIETFSAGADIALMPFTIRNLDDISQFDRFMTALYERIRLASDKAKLVNSYERIARTKASLIAQAKQPNQLAKQAVTMADKQQLATQLARASVTQVSGDVGILNGTASKRILLVMPDALRCAGMRKALQLHAQAHAIDCMNTTTLVAQDPRLHSSYLTQFDVVIAGDISPQISLAEMGGMDDLSQLLAQQGKRNSLTQQHDYIRHVFNRVSATSKRIFVALRTPYTIVDWQAMTDATFAIYDYRVDESTLHSTSLEAFVYYLYTEQQAPGQLPVSLPTPPDLH